MPDYIVTIDICAASRSVCRLPACQQNILKGHMRLSEPRQGYCYHAPCLWLSFTESGHCPLAYENQLNKIEVLSEENKKILRDLLSGTTLPVLPLKIKKSTKLAVKTEKNKANVDVMVKISTKKRTIDQAEAKQLSKNLNTTTASASTFSSRTATAIEEPPPTVEAQVKRAKGRSRIVCL